MDQSRIKINKQYIRDYLDEHHMTLANASRAMGKNSNYMSLVLWEKNEAYSPAVVDSLVKLGLSRDILCGEKEYVLTKEEESSMEICGKGKKMYKLNTGYVRRFLRENDLTDKDASQMLGMNVYYVSNTLSRAEAGASLTNTVVKKFVSLGMDFDQLTGTDEHHIETATGKILEKPLLAGDELHKKLFDKKIERDPKVEEISRAVDENGEHLPFSKRMELLRKGKLTATIDKRMDEVLGMADDGEEEALAKVPSMTEEVTLEKPAPEPNNRKASLSVAAEECFPTDRYKRAYLTLFEEILSRFAKNPAEADISLLEKIQRIERDIIQTR